MIKTDLLPKSFVEIAQVKPAKKSSEDRTASSIKAEDRIDPTKVSLSAHARAALDYVQEQTANELPFDVAKVESIRQAIAEGLFFVDVDHIARGLMSLDKDFKL